MIFLQNHVEEYGEENNSDKDGTWCEEDLHQVLLAWQGFGPARLQAPANIKLSNIKYHQILFGGGQGFGLALLQAPTNIVLDLHEQFQMIDYNPLVM